MADILRLTRLLQDTATYTSVDLLTTDAMKLQAHSFRTRTAPMEGNYSYGTFGAQQNFDHFGVVTETIPLFGNAASTAITERLNDIEHMLERARKHHDDPVMFMPVWLEWQTGGELGTKRALVYEGSLQFGTSIGNDAFIGNNQLIATLVLTRHPFWESSSISAAYPDPPYSLEADGDFFVISNINGLAPARIDETGINSTNNRANPITNVWLGIRPEHNGTDDFDPSWELRYGTMGTDAEVTTGTNYVTVDFSGTETPLTERVGITVEQALNEGNPSTGINFSHMAGRYLVLCRCYVGASTTVGLQMRHGYSGSAAQPGNEIFIENTSYELVELGEVQIPTSRLGYGGGLNPFIRQMEIQLWAERVDGSGSLFLDELILIPSRHFVYVEGIEASSVAGASVATRPNDTVLSYGRTTDDVDLMPVPAPTNWYLPPNNSILVVAAQRASSHVRTDILAISLQFYPRWYSYYGSTSSGSDITSG
jgi:hypothetical protein